jgi:hypothetical protein
MKLNPFTHSEGPNEIRAQSLVIYTVKNTESTLKKYFLTRLIFEIHVTDKHGNTSFSSVNGHGAKVCLV